MKRLKILKRTVQVSTKKPQKSRLYALTHADEIADNVSLSFRDRAVLRFSKLIGSNLIQKDQRSPVPQYIFESTPTVVEPRHDQIALYEDFNNSWITRQIKRAIIQEVLGRSWKIEAKFSKKCTECGKEFEDDVEECDECAKNNRTSLLRDPNQMEHQIAEELTSNPNTSYNFRRFLASTISYLLALDDYYWSVAYGYIIQGDKRIRKARELYVEDTRFMRPIADKFGRLGNDEYFCPQCYDPDSDQPVVKLQPDQIRRGIIPSCPNCHGPVYQTVYVQMVQGKIYSRLARDEMVHGSGEAVLPELHGNPKILSAIKLIRTIEAMDEYNLGVYSEGKIGSFVVFPGMQQGEVDTMLSQAEEAIKKREKEELKTGKLIAKRKIRTVVLGVKEPPIRLPVMEDMEKMQSLEFYKLCVEKVCALWGVTPVFVSIIESGKSGANPRMQIDVQDRTTREVQTMLESSMNEQVFPLFNIHDWTFKFEELEQRDELRDAQIDQTKSVTARNYLAAGFKVTINEEGELEVSGEGTQGQGEPIPPGGQGTERLPVESEASGDLLQRIAKNDKTNKTKTRVKHKK